MKDKRQVVFYKIPLKFGDNISRIREKAWLFLFDSYNEGVLQRNIYEFLYSYAREHTDFIDEDILEFDKRILEDGIKEINITETEGIIVFNRVSNLFKRNGLNFDDEIITELETLPYQLYRIMFAKLKYQQSDILQEESDMRRLSENQCEVKFNQILELYREVSGIEYLKNKMYAVTNRIEFLILDTSTEDTRLSLLKLLFNSNLEINLHPAKILNSFKGIDVLEELEEIVLSKEFFNKSFWLYCIYVKMSVYRANQNRCLSR